MSRRNREKRTRAEQLQLCQRILDTTPTDLVTNMLSGPSNPLVAITLIGPAVTVQGIPLSRSMGCIVERLPGNLRLVMTCRHAFENLTNGYRLTVAMKNPRPSPLLPIGQPLGDPEPESDVAFLVVRDMLDAPTKPLIIQLSDPPLNGMQPLYNAANRCDPLSRYYEVFVARQAAKERQQRAFCKMSVRTTQTVPVTDLVRQEELRQLGWISCRMLQMHSRTGFSGSPVWNENLQLYGIDVRGTEPGDGVHENMGNVLVCLPTSELYLARQRVQSQLDQLLNSL
jgi:hypothetical protein